MSAGEQQNIITSSYEGLRPQTRGTVGDPIPLSTAQEFIDVLSAAPSKFYYLTNTIDLLEVGSFWDQLPSMNGGLDGRGYSIIGLQINTDNGTGTPGFITRINTGAHVKNFALELGSAGIDAGVSGTYKGSVAADLYGILENVIVTALGSGGLHTQDDRAGGIIGITQGASIMRDCFAAVPIHGTIGIRVGGGVGFENMAISSTPGCMFDSDIANTTEAGVNDTPIARTTAQMQVEGTTSLWNKVSVWSHDVGNYPVLRTWNDADYVPIATRSEFLGQVNVASNPGMFRLAADIDLGGDAIEPHDFYGLLDGHGYEVKNFRVDSSHSASGAGLFGLIARGGGVSFMGVAVASINANDAGVSYAAPLASRLHGFVDHCYARSCHVTTNSDRAGGLIGAAINGYGNYLGNNYAQSQRTGNVSTRVGGMAGFVNTHIMTNTGYFDETTWGDATDGTGRSYGVARVTSAMMNEATYVGWDFADVFQVDNPGSETPTMVDFRQDPRVWYPFQTAKIGSGDLVNYTRPVYTTAFFMKNQFLPKQNWFSPLREGTCNAVVLDVRLHENTSGDWDRTTGWDLRVWKAVEGNNPFEVLSSDNWTLVSTGILQSESLNTTSTGGVIQRISVPLSEFYMEIGNQYSDGQHKDFGFGYGLEMYQTAANSWNGSTGANSHSMVWFNARSMTNMFGNCNDAGTAIRRDAVTAADRTGFGFKFVGDPTFVSSDVGDQPIGQYDWDQSSFNTGLGQLGGNDSPDWEWRGVPFYAVGSQVTRVAFSTAFDGSTAKGSRCFICTDSNGFANINDIIGSSQTALNSDDVRMGTDGNYFTGDIDTKQMAALYVFSTPANVNSGTLYWAVAQGGKYADAVNNLIHLQFNQVDSADPRGRFFRRSVDGGTTEVITGNTFQHEIWMKNFFEGDDVEDGAVNRAFPTGDQRDFPTWALREKHKP